MSEAVYLRPLLLADSPQAVGGAAVRLAGGLAYASHIALIRREGGRVVARSVLEAGAVPAAMAALPPALKAEAEAQWAALQAPRAPLHLGARTIRLDQPQVMGILNVTPDSFSDGGQWMERPGVAEEHAAAMLEAGAALIDIGGESTRPGAPPVWEGDEMKRVIPLVAHLARAGAAISLDTRRLAVMEEAVAA
ncbi:MAG TPA: dihydropteroate synthase, partial [Novosphingobium sp.]|nr:dihydropteroate synthase [Novosphingobium sp.]